VIRESAERSRDRLGLARLDLLYAHIEDPAVPLAETVEAFAALVAEGTVGLLGVSNHWAWRVERARSLAAAAGVPGYEVLQYHSSYLRPRTDLPGPLSPDGEQGVASGDLLSYVRAGPQLTMVAYSPLLGGGYVRQDKPLDAEFDHPGTLARLAALREVAKDADATVPVIPLVGASSVAQLDESLAAGISGARRGIVVPASFQLVRTLMEHDLAREPRLKIFPVVLGAGERLFGETSDKKPMRLLDTQAVEGGIAFLTYQPVPDA
jgi:hypothetical protein